MYVVIFLIFFSRVASQLESDSSCLEVMHNIQSRVRSRMRTRNGYCWAAVSRTWLLFVTSATGDFTLAGVECKSLGSWPHLIVPNIAAQLDWLWLRCQASGGFTYF